MKSNSRSDAYFDTCNEQPMHVFSEPEVVEGLLKLRDVLNEWHQFHVSEWQPDDESMMIGRDVLEALPATLIAFRDCFKRRMKQIANDNRELSRPFKPKRRSKRNRD